MVTFTGIDKDPFVQLPQEIVKCPSALLPAGSWLPSTKTLAVALVVPPDGLADNQGESDWIEKAAAGLPEMVIGCEPGFAPPLWYVKLNPCGDAEIVVKDCGAGPLMVTLTDWPPGLVQNVQDTVTTPPVLPVRLPSAAATLTVEGVFAEAPVAETLTLVSLGE
jgi:hypothetical protein